MLIDLVICFDILKIFYQGVCDLGILDYYLIYVIVNFKRKCQKLMFKIVYDYKKVDLDLLRMDFVVVLWSICNVFDNLDDVIWVWEYLYKDIMKFYFYV